MSDAARRRLPRLAREFAGQIAYKDWSDAPFRADRAGHLRAEDRHAQSLSQLTEEQTERVRLNVMWVTAQVLGYAGFLRDEEDVYAFAELCGVDVMTPSGRRRSRHIMCGLRMHPSGLFCPPNHPDDLLDDADDEDQ